MNPGISKAQQVFQDLNFARSNEIYTEIPGLAKKYKKYHPFETVLEATAIAEAEFVLLVRKLRNERNQSVFIKRSQTAIQQADLDPPNTPIISASQISVGDNRKWGTLQLTPSVSSSASLSRNGTLNNFPEEIDFIYALDDRNSVSVPIRISPSNPKVQVLLAQLVGTVQRQIKSGQLETTDDWQAQLSKIVLSRMNFETGRYDRAFEWLQELALRADDVDSGYGMVLLVQARVIKGIYYESQGNYVEALNSYLQALGVTEDRPQEKSKALLFWIEDCLYRAILLQLRMKGEVKQTLRLMRIYLHNCTTQLWPADWRIHKRWVLFRHYIRYLTKAYQKGVYAPVSSDDSSLNPAAFLLSPTASVFSSGEGSSSLERPAAALDEMIQLVTQFQELLRVFAEKKGNSDPVDINHRALELSNSLVAAHEAVGWKDLEYDRQTASYFKYASEITTASLSTARYTFHTLVRMGEIEKAKLALIRYLELLGVPNILDKDVFASLAQHPKKQAFHDDVSSDEDDDGSILEDLVNTIQSKLDHINNQSSQSAQDNLQNQITLLSLLKLNEGNDHGFLPDENDEHGESNAAQKKVPTGSFESESEFDVVKLLNVAVQQLYKDHGQEAAVLSDIAIILLEESKTLQNKKGTQWKSLMAQSKRIRGASYGVYASQCTDEKQRLKYQIEALSSLESSKELENSWKVHYELGLQEASMGEMTEAIVSIQESIKLRGDFIPSWHLFALVQSSRQFNALPKSLQLVQKCLEYHMNLLVEETDTDFFLDSEEGQNFFDRAEAYMELQMSQVYILETLEGTEAVLKTYPDVFDIYSKLSKKMNLEMPASERDAPQPTTTSRTMPFSDAPQDLSTSNSEPSTRRPRSYSNKMANNIQNNNKQYYDDNNSPNASSIGFSEQTRRQNAESIMSDDRDDEDGYSNTPTSDVYELTLSSLRIHETDLNSALEPKKKNYAGGFSLLKSKSSKGKKKPSNLRPTKESSSFVSIKTINSPVTASPKSSQFSFKKDSGMESPTTESSFSYISPAQPAKSPLSNMTNQHNSMSAPKLSSLRQTSSSYFNNASTNNEQINESNDSPHTSYTNVSSSMALFHSERYEIYQTRWQNLLVKLWIMTSNTYLRAQRFEESFDAASEADTLTSGTNTDVWNQIGLIILQEGIAKKKLLKKNQSHSDKVSNQYDVLDTTKDSESAIIKDYQERALDAFKKAMSIEPENTTTQVSLASTYLEMGEFELAEQLLERTTKGLGWNQIEAWYILSKVYREQGNLEDAKDSLLYALSLSETSPSLSLGRLPRFV